MFVLSKNLGQTKTLVQQAFSTSTSYSAQKSFKLVVIGGGSGGCTTASKFVGKLGKGNVAIIEPRDTHYYQPLWTLVGGGLKDLDRSGKPMRDVLPKDAEWIKDSVAEFNPQKNRITTANGDEISYEFLVISMGIQLNYKGVKGLEEALETPGVGSNYSKDHVKKTWKAITNFKEGNAIFTHPNTPIKCGGAPQKIMYITEKTFRKQGKRDKANIMFESSLPRLFAVEKYENALWKVVKERGINVNLRSNLIEVKPDTREAIFQNLDKPEETKSVKYEMLHVTPPMHAPDALRNSGREKKLTDDDGWLNLNKETLQHVVYPNIFGLGDCTNIPTSKTAAAVAGQSGILRRNLKAAMDGKPLQAKYDGYTSCPLVTGRGECILAEFDFSTPPQPLETFPFDQGKPRWIVYIFKAHFMPHCYWFMTKGYWEGPKIIRKLLHFGTGR